MNTVMTRASYNDRKDLTATNDFGRILGEKRTLVLDGKETTPFEYHAIRVLAYVIGLTDADFGHVGQVSSSTIALDQSGITWLKENGFFEIAQSRHGLQPEKDSYRKVTYYTVIKKSDLGQKMTSRYSGTCKFSGKKIEAGATIWYNSATRRAVLDSEISNIAN